MAEPLVRLEQVWKAYGGKPVLRGVSLAIGRGEVACLFGPSGAGKSTLLRCINALEPPDRGLVTVAGSPVGVTRHGPTWRRLPERAASRQRAGIGMVFQSFNLFPHRTVLQNVADAPIHILRQPRPAAEAEATALLAQLGMAAFAGAYPAALSGGQQQRVAIARALAMRPALMLFDEPTSALDPQRVGEVACIIRGLARTGMTVIVVTHEIAFAREVADTASVLIDGEIAETGPASAVLNSPADERVRAFLSSPSQDTAPCPTGSSP